MKKFYFLLTLLFCSIIFISCGYKDISLSALDILITKEITMQEFSKANSKELKKFFGIKNTDISEFLFYAPAYSMDVSEFLIIKLDSTDNIDNLKDLIDSRVSKQIESFASYGPEQCALLEDYTLNVKGNYIFYSVGSNTDEIYKIFLENIEN
ncbi:MAG: DUF4358 domain-containing protein [Sarcina sp.]